MPPAITPLVLPNFSDLPEQAAGTVRVQVRLKGTERPYFTADSAVGAVVPAVGHRIRFTDELAAVDSVDWYPTGNGFFIDVQCVACPQTADGTPPAAASSAHDQGRLERVRPRLFAAMLTLAAVAAAVLSLP